MKLQCANMQLLCLICSLISVPPFKMYPWTTPESNQTPTQTSLTIQSAFYVVCVWVCVYRCSHRSLNDAWVDTATGSASSQKETVCVCVCVLVEVWAASLRTDGCKAERFTRSHTSQTHTHTCTCVSSSIIQSSIICVTHRPRSSPVSVQRQQKRFRVSISQYTDPPRPEVKN